MKLVPDTISDDTVACLRHLLSEARAGRAIGIAFVVVYKGKRYSANVAGEAKRSPTFTRGMIATLDDKLARQIDQP
jgi:hypothetical protein